MAQIANLLPTITGNDEAPTEKSAALIAFETAAYAVEQTFAALADARADAKPAAEAFAKATRAASWAAFEVVRQINDLDAAKAEGERLALMIADARQIDDKNRPVYALRGRDLATFADELAKIGAPYVATKGKAKGETVNPRATKDALTQAKTLRETIKERAERKASETPYLPAARVLAAKEIEAKLQKADPAATYSEDDLIASLSSSDKAEQTAALMTVQTAVETLQSRATLQVEFMAMVQRLADCGKLDWALDEIQVAIGRAQEN